MRVSRGVIVSLIVAGLLAVPVVSVTLGQGEPGRVVALDLQGVDTAVVAEAPGGLVVASAVEGNGSTGQAPGAPPEMMPTDAAPAVLTGKVSTDEFSAVGFTWDAASADGVVVQARVREEDGWTEWFAVPQSDDGPDAGTESARRAAGRSATELLVTAEADAIQIRADAATGTQPEGLKAVLVDPGEVAAAAIPVDSAGAAPGVISRAEWGGSTPTGDCAPEYASELKAAVVHHTAGSNDYTADRSAGIVRAIWLYHTSDTGRGWCDIGYNALVDRFGQIFEGAAGGLRRPVIGAHAGGFNTSTFGISALGTYSTVAAPAAMTDAISEMIAWKFAAAGIDPRGTTQLTSGGYTSKFPAGTKVTLPVIVGHRDVGQTSCPGDQLYGRMGSMRAQVAELVAAASRDLVRTVEDPTVFVVSGSSKYVVGDQATLSSLSPLGPVGFVSQQYLDRRTTVSRMSRVVLSPEGTVYFIDSGIRLPFGSCEQVADYGADCASLVRLEQSLVDAFHPGPPVTPVYRTTSGKAFYVTGGVKREVADDASLVAAGLPGHSVTLKESGLADLPYGVPVIRDGLVAQNRSSRAVAVVAGGAVTTVSEEVRVATAWSALPVRGLDDSSMRVLTIGSAPGAVVRESGGSRVFLLTEAGKRVLADPAMVSAGTPVIPAAALALLPDAAPVEAGTFVKGSGAGTVFALRAGQLRMVSSWAGLVALNGGGADPRILSIDQRVADVLPRGAQQLVPGGLVVAPRSSMVYLVNGVAELVPVGSFAVTDELGVSRVSRVSDSDVEAYALRSAPVSTVVECAGTRYLGLGGKLYRFGATAGTHYPALPVTSLDALTCAALPKAPGELTRFLRAGDGTIHYIDNGLKRAIPSYGQYQAMGGTVANTIQVSGYALSLIPTGPRWGEPSTATAAATPAPAPTSPSSPAPSTATGTATPAPAPTSPSSPAPTAEPAPDTTSPPSATSGVATPAP
ncbi:peptidoglycan recognition protein [Blastococcus saxobsidens]|uniref:N-acetylmuramoyl-L-alanine amidase n=1 Tax=Blastococcus saxobsidens (strain DD2) TaxID=1146883 RepID=H6RL14_BLASD|nr:peptidoglycan recognition protein [Blastococcus saxobsidens]CCG04981.1 N-acetylmuramoyl-L-alanine amidase [Blastococcus saxobsidens DD2]